MAPSKASSGSGGGATKGMGAVSGGRGGSGARESGDAPVPRSIIGGSGYRVMRTAPDKLMRHDISDEDLSMLLQHENRDFEKDILWASVGAVVGALAPAMQAISMFGGEGGEFGFVELGTCIVFAGGAALAFVMGLILYRRPKKSPAEELAQAIRERTARELGTEGVQP